MFEGIKHAINVLSRPQYYFTLVTILLFISTNTRLAKYFWTKKSGIIGLAFIGVFMGFSLRNPNFRAIITFPDNVPIIGMLLLVFFFTWLSMYQAFRNDNRIMAGGVPVEMETTHDKVFVWPDLLYVEFIAGIIASIILVIWALGLQAPLEEPANPNVSPNPAKAPWYFLGLQETLVYFDPWIAGVVLPSFIIIGLMAIPYLDKNPKGNGYFTFVERRFAITFFMYGFLVLWVALIIVGTVLRGPNWNFFGPYEFWDVHKLEALVNVNLSEIIWVKILHTGLPRNWLIREIFGIGLVTSYLFVVPKVLARTWLKGLYRDMGAARFYIFAFLLLVMVAMPIKFYLRWMFNLKYIVAIPEFFFNI
jgi:hypothetical protein